MATKQQEEAAAQLAEFLASGGTIQEIPRGRSGYSAGETRSAWGAPKKKQAKDTKDSAAKKP